MKRMVRNDDMSRKHSSKAKAGMTSTQSGEIQNKGSIYMPLGVAQKVFVKAYLDTPIITWEKDTEDKKGTLVYTLKFDTTDTVAKANNSIRLVEQYQVRSNTSTGVTTTTSGTLASEIASIQALGLPADQQKMCIDALISKYGGK
jgi:hypothetical protein